MVSILSIVLVLGLLLTGLAQIFGEPLEPGLLLCTLTKGKTRSCGMTVGGIAEEMYFGNWDDIDPTFVTDADNFAADGSIVTLILGTGKKVFKYDCEKNTCSLVQALQVGANKFVNATITGSISGYDQATKNEMEKFALAKVFAIVKFKGTNKYVAVGLPNKDGAGNPLECSALEYNSGTSETDASAWNFTMAGGQTFFANQITFAAFSTLIYVPA